MTSAKADYQEEVISFYGWFATKELSYLGGSIVLQG
jgi:hypothetical protein